MISVFNKILHTMSACTHSAVRHCQATCRPSDLTNQVTQMDVGQDWVCLDVETKYGGEEDEVLWPHRPNKHPWKCWKGGMVQTCNEKSRNCVLYVGKGAMMIEVQGRRETTKTEMCMDGQHQG